MKRTILFALLALLPACSSEDANSDSGSGGATSGGGGKASGGSSSGGAANGGTASGGTASGGTTSTGGSSGSGGNSGSGGLPECPPAAGGAAAAPNISCISGSAQNGGALTIVGTGFGANGPNVVMFDDFEKGAIGSPIQTGAGSAQIGTWAGLNTGIPVYGDEHVVSGTHAFKADFTVDSAQQAVMDLPAGTTEIFYSWWQFVPTGHHFPGEGSVDLLNWKVIWLLGNDSFGGGTADDDLFLAFLGDGAGPAATFGGNCSVYTNGALWPEIHAVKGEWNRIWVWDRGRTDQTGAVEIWELRATGPEKLNDESSAQTLPTNCGGAPHQWEQVSFNGYGRLTPSPANAYLDDFYVATGSGARARVEIGNAATYAASTKLTLATPTAWSDGSISANLWLGPFASGEQAYVYVFDANGGVNSAGFPLTL